MMFYLILAGHWFSDFVAQTDDMAKNKSKSIKWLTKHIVSYTFGIAIFSLPIFYRMPGKYWLLFVLINGSSHWVIDFFTSKLSSKMWQQQRVHDFFVVVGFDQFLHVAILYGTWAWLT